jgi:nicotinamide-nucleotide amidase
LIVEIVAVGTELLLGQIVNSNGAEIAKRLAAEGFDSHYQVVVGDNLARLVTTLRNAAERADAIVISGGIGPTQDDLTREAICELTGRTMVRDAEHAAWIESRVRAQGRHTASNVLKMADLPEGAEPLPNVNGVALGIGLEHDGTWMFAMPGVPSEMIPMFEYEVLPRLRTAAGEPAVLVSRILKCWGPGESSVADLLDDLYDSANPSVAFMIKNMEVLVRITAKAKSAEEAEELIAPMEREIRNRLGDEIYAADDVTVEQLVVSALRAVGWTVSTLERATRGRIGARLDDADPTGEVFAGTVVPGAGPALPPRGDVIIEVGPIGVGAGDARTRPVEISLATPAGGFARTFAFGGDDETIREFAAVAGLHVLRLAIEDGDSD